MSTNKISERYKKALVTVAMGFRTEEDIRKNGLYIFNKDEKEELIEMVSKLLKKNNSVLVLEVKQTGYRSKHINIKSDIDLENFINDIDSIYKENNEIWVVSSSVEECWRCRIYLSNNNYDTIEMAYSYDDHILDHIGSNLEVPYILFKKEKNTFKVSKTNLNNDMNKKANLIVQEILSKYSNSLNRVKEDLNYIGIKGISLDIRVSNGYDFHDFDVSYEKVGKVINYYLNK